MTSKNWYLRQKYGYILDDSTSLSPLKKIIFFLYLHVKSGFTGKMKLHA